MNNKRYSASWQSPLHDWVLNIEIIFWNTERNDLQDKQKYVSSTKYRLSRSSRRPYVVTGSAEFMPFLDRSRLLHEQYINV